VSSMEHIECPSDIDNSRLWLWRLCASSEETNDMRSGQEVALAIEGPGLVLGLADVSDSQVLRDIFLFAFSITVVPTGREVKRQREKQRERQ
jgi:hypothetical protein